MKNQNLFNRKSLKFFRSSLRKKSTSAEVELVIELDGNPNGEYHKIEKDKTRETVNHPGWYQYLYQN